MKETASSIEVGNSVTVSDNCPIKHIRGLVGKVMMDYADRNWVGDLIPMYVVSVNDEARGGIFNYKLSIYEVAA